MLGLEERPGISTGLETLRSWERVAAAELGIGGLL